MIQEALFGEVIYHRGLLGFYNKTIGIVLRWDTERRTLEMNCSKDFSKDIYPPVFHLNGKIDEVKACIQLLEAYVSQLESMKKEIH